MIAFRNLSRNIIRAKYVLAHRVNGELTEVRLKTKEDSFFINPEFTATGNPERIIKYYHTFLINLSFIVKISKDQRCVCTFRNPKKLYQKNVEGHCFEQSRIKGKPYFALLQPSDESLKGKPVITNDLVINTNENKFVFDLYENFKNKSNTKLNYEAFYVRPAEKSIENQKG